MKKIILLLLVFILNGCVLAPKGLERKTDQIQNIQDIKQTDYACQCKKARLAGKVLNAVALKNKVRIEILSYPVLRFSAKPIIDTLPNGRFIAYVDGFIDPEILKDQYMSFSGILTKIETGRIDQVEYQYPVLKIENYKLWKLVREYYYDSEDWTDYREARHRGILGFSHFWQPTPKVRWNLY